MNHLHREKLFSLFDDNQDAIVYMQGAELMYRYDTDFEFAFRQESNFWYLSGVNEPDFHLILDLKNRDFHLFAPKRDAQYAVWHGRVKTKAQYQEEYAPDHLHYDTALPGVLKDLDPETIYCLNETQAEYVEQLDRNFSLELDTLSEALTHCRVFKTEPELEKLREAGEINNRAHRAVLNALEPGRYEYELKAVFEYEQITHGLMQEAYNGIFASGTNSAILHYVENNRQVKDGDLFLIDAGSEQQGYASDITRTYPANGTFTADQAAIYEAVLESQKQVIAMIEPNVQMEDLHIRAARVMMQGLKDAGIVKGSIDDLMEEDIFALFFPHGLGHFLGLDTHDVGGYPKGVDKIERPGLKYLRTRRNLQPGMVITVEPGLYMVPALLKPALEKKETAAFLNRDKIETLYDFGGVRIEDDIVVTDDGYENLTDVPKERDDIERIMQQ